MRIRIMVIVSIFSIMLLSGCIKIYASPPEGEATSAPGQAQGTQESTQASTQQSVQDASAQPPAAPSGNATQPEEKLPDLVPTEILYDSASVTTGQQIYFDSGIRNVGTSNCGGFNIKWFVNGEEMGHGGHPGIAAGGADMTSNSQFYWTPTTIGSYQIEFLVDSEDMVKESVETNNSIAISVQVSANVWGETPVHLGTKEVLFDVYTEKAEVDLNGDGTLDRIEYHAGKTIAINGGVYPSTHVNYAQSFAIVDILPGDHHLEILLNPAYRKLGSDAADIPSSWFCWWDGSIIHGFGMKGVLFDGQWRDSFDPTRYFHGDNIVTFLTPYPDNSGYYWGDFAFDQVNYKFEPYTIRIN